MPHPQLRHILSVLQTYCKQEYGDRLMQIVLFGSQARGDAASNSDIDVLIILQGSVSPVNEIKQISEFITDLCLKYNTLISCIFTSDEQFQRSNSPLLLNIRREGIAV